MTNARKFLIVGIVLILPAIIFSFLKLFGENRFDVEILHTEGLNVVGCESNGMPHQVPAIDSLALTVNELKVVYIDFEKLTKDRINEIRRLSQNHPQVEFSLIIMENENLHIAEEYIQENWTISTIKNQDLEELNRCGFGNIDSQDLILVDADRHVRGYYDFSDRRELDRLEGELKILK